MVTADSQSGGGIGFGKRLRAASGPRIK